MQMTILVDNHTNIDDYYFGEPGVCYYIENEEDRILLDTGYSDICIQNANLMQIDLSKVNKIVLSHGHDDHTRGLKFLNQKGLLAGKKIIAHPDVFERKEDEGLSICSPYRKEEMEGLTELLLSKEPIEISKHLFFLGEIPQMVEFEPRKIIGRRFLTNTWQDDYVLDDSALVYKGKSGLTIITGCSHSGICNIIEYAKKVCKEDRIDGIIGGFHLLDQCETMRLQRTAAYIKKQNKEHRITNLCPCHCVSFEAKVAIHKEVPIHSMGVGEKIYVE